MGGLKAPINDNMLKQYKHHITNVQRLFCIAMVLSYSLPVFMLLRANPSSVYYR